jgi:hypothetical protein
VRTLDVRHLNAIANRDMIQGSAREKVVFAQSLFDK